MSEPKPMYQIMPVGEICLRYDDHDPEPVTEAKKVTDERKLFLNQLDGWIRKINLAIGKIEPFISQEQVTIPAKHGDKVVFPCLTDLYKVLTEMQAALFQLRKDGNR